MEQVKGDSLVKKGILSLIGWYSQVLNACCVGHVCRFEPTCSAYTSEAIKRHGVAWGLKLGLWRVLRCHPGCQGGLDPVPPVEPVQSGK